MPTSSTPNEVEDAIWEAAARLPLQASWKQVKCFLLDHHINVQARREEAWMDTFNRSQKWVEVIREKSRSDSPPADNFPVLGVAKLSMKAGPPSPPEDPEIMPPTIVAIVKESEWSPDGTARVWCRQSDEYEEDGIRELIAEKLGCPIDSMGRTVLTFAAHYGGRFLTRSFKVLPDGDVDIMFRKDPWKEEARQAEEKASKGDHHEPDLDSYADEEQRQQRTEMDDERSAQKIAAEAIGTSLSKLDLLNLSPDKQLDFGSMLGRLSLSAARAIKDEVVSSLANPVQDRGRRMQPVSPTRRACPRNVP